MTFDLHPTSWLGGAISLLGLVILVEAGLQVQIIGSVPSFMQGIWGGLLVTGFGVLLMTKGASRAATWLKSIITEVLG